MAKLCGFAIKLTKILAAVARLFDLTSSSISADKKVPFFRYILVLNEISEHFRSMRSNTHNSRVLQLAEQKGYIRPTDLDAIGAPRVVLTRLTASGALVKIDRGLYSLTQHSINENESLVIVAAKVPQAVICLLSALQFHELTTQLPRQVWIAMPRGSHLPRLDYPPLRMVQFSSEAYANGIEIHEQGNCPIRVYSAAKTIADCFKHRNAIGLDVALEALKDGLSSGKSSTDDIWHHAKINRVANVIRPYMEAIL